LAASTTPSRQTAPATGPTPTQQQPQQQQAVNNIQPSGSTLTQEMLTQALLQAMSSVGNTNSPRGGNSSTSSSSANRSRREENALNEQFGRFLPQMRELGITDDSLSLRALQATNGDVQAAVNLVYAGLVDD